MARPNRTRLGTEITLFAALLFATAPACFAQESTQQPVDTRVEPIYPRKPYSFRTTGSNYDPYQFNWATGRWDYVPIPYASQTPGPNYSPYVFNTYTGHWDYVPLPSPSQSNAQSTVIAPPPAPPSSATTPPLSGSSAINAESPAGMLLGAAAPAPTDDSPLWVRPTTRPAPELALRPRTLTFQGRIVSQRAVILTGDATPHLLLRLRNSDGASGTVDVGSQLDLPELNSNSPKDQVLTVTGYVGDIDGTIVLFANSIRIGSRTITVDRHADGAADH